MTFFRRYKIERHDVVDIILAIAGVLLVIWSISSCGKATPIVEPKILPPNVAELCARGLACHIILKGQEDACIACVESVADKWNEEAKAMWGDPLPPLSQVPCEVLEAEAHRTQLSSCIVGRWYGP